MKLRIHEPFLVPVLGVFAPPSGGVVVVGYRERGEVQPGDAVEVVGPDRAPRQAVVAAVWPGRPGFVGSGVIQPLDRLALLLPDLRPEEVALGQVLAAPGSVQTYKAFRARIRQHEAWYGRPNRPLHDRRILQVFVHGGDYDGIVVLPPGMAQLNPGEEGELGIELLHTAVLEPGVNVILREGGIRTLATGSVTSVGST